MTAECDTLRTLMRHVPGARAVGTTHYGELRVLFPEIDARAPAVPEARISLCDRTAGMVRLSLWVSPDRVGRILRAAGDESSFDANFPLAGFRERHMGIAAKYDAKESPGEVFRRLRDAVSTAPSHAIPPQAADGDSPR